MQSEIDDLKRKLEDEKQNMGAAGKRREDELLKEIANLKKELKNTNQIVEDLKQKNSLLQDKITEQDKTIEDLQNQIQQLNLKIARLEQELEKALMSGDQITQQLRDQLRKLSEDFDQFKVKAAKDFESMQMELGAKSQKALDVQKQRYEQMIDELKKQLNGDKEFVQNELRKKIAELEK